VSVDERESFDLTSEDLDTSFKLIPEGWYTVEIDDVDDELESSNGNKQYLVKYKSVDEAFKGTQWDYIAVTKSAIQNIMSLSRAAGLPVPTKEKPGKYTLPDPDDLIGKVIQIEIVHEDDYKGATDDDGNVIRRAKVRFAGRKKEGEKVGKTPAKSTTKAGAPAKGKAPARGKAAAVASDDEDGFSL
jgi:hypothetical protein